MPLLSIAAPATFVVLWSSAFIFAKLGMPYTEPLTFMASRFVLVSLAFLGLALIFRAPWPRSPAEILHISVVGLLVHAIYLSGVFVAISWGFPAAMAALVLGLQPVLIAILSGPFLGQSPRLLQWVGCAVGFVGVVATLADRVDLTGADLSGALICVVSLLCICAGTLYQKRFCANMPLLAGSTIQAIVATFATGACAIAFESLIIRPEPPFLFAMAWLVIVVSIGAFSLLMIMIRRGEATKVASLFYLVPPTAAVMAWAVFDEPLTPSVLAGIGVASAGVAMVVLGGERTRST